MSPCPFKNSSGNCVPPGEASGPQCSFSGSDFESLCAVYPAHKAKSQGQPLSAQEAMATAYSRGFAQERAREEQGGEPGRASGPQGCLVVILVVAFIIGLALIA